MPSAPTADIAGVLALAPYLGEPETAAAVARAGGLAHWTAPGESKGPPPSDDDEIGRQAWRSVQNLVRPGGPASPSPSASASAEPSRAPVYLGYGLSDRFAPAEKLLAEALPPQRVFTAPGGHDWDPWVGLWPRMLAASDLPRCTNATR